MRNDIDVMLDCYLSCTKTITHCLEQGGEHADPRHINLLMDCAKICNVASDFACRESANHPAVYAVCADICKQCADACDALAEDDPAMAECAEICRKCAEVCERMSE